jgi:plasmid stability protein
MRCFELETRTSCRRTRTRRVACAALSKRPDGACPGARHHQSHYANPRPVLTTDYKHGGCGEVAVWSVRGAPPESEEGLRTLVFEHHAVIRNDVKYHTGRLAYSELLWPASARAVLTRALHVEYTPLRLLWAAEHLEVEGSALDERLHQARSRQVMYVQMRAILFKARSAIATCRRLRRIPKSNFRGLIDDLAALLLHVLLI